MAQSWSAAKRAAKGPWGEVERAIVESQDLGGMCEGSCREVAGMLPGLGVRGSNVVDGTHFAAGAVGGT